MSDALPLLWGMALPAALGVLVLQRSGLRFAGDRLGFPAWAWLTGCLALAVLLLGCLLLGVPPAQWPWAPALAIVALAIWRRRVPEPSAAPPAPPVGWPLWMVVALGAAGIALLAFAVASHPCVTADEANMWALKAKSLHVDWYRGEFAAAQRFAYHPDYPLLNPLLQAWVYGLNGEIVHSQNRVPIQLCALALWLALASALRRRLPSALAALLLVPMLLATEFQDLCRWAYADGMLALGLVVALDGWLRLRAAPHRGHAALLGLGLAFAMWSKNEGALYVGLALAAGAAAPLLRQEVPWRAAPGEALGRAVRARWLWPPLLVVLFQSAWNAVFGLRNDLFLDHPASGTMTDRLVGQFAERAPVVLDWALGAVLGPASAHAVLLLPWLALVLVPRLALSAALWAPTLALVGSFVALHVVYIGSYLGLQHHLETSHARVLFQAVPAGTVWFAAVFAGLRLDGRPGVSSRPDAA
ncbi:MAG: hypothetical protein AB7O97_00620 [Planctomycetota bacterium]